ncbi:hypothetical protein GCM10009430_07300 [Aquimarina litoralis]|uniref:Uncharacterized protein n=1 Tax=Aquimarina litoralis TaxID=584605 RepID=A0ABN1II72_9FLAO
MSTVEEYKPIPLIAKSKESFIKFLDKKKVATLSVKKIKTKDIIAAKTVLIPNSTGTILFVSSILLEEFLKELILETKCIVVEAIPTSNNNAK